MAEPGKTESERKWYVFVDDSNLWIEGQKFKGEKLRDAGMDPRFRVDLGRLLTLLIGNPDHLVKAFLYGSRPPPNDTVWKAARKRNFDVNVYERAGGDAHGREKEVDIAMASCITKEATELKYACKYGAPLPYDISEIVFVIATGDRDMKPAVEATLEAGIQVELWAWKKGISTVYKQLANERKGMKVSVLDSVESKFGYTHVQSTRKPGDINPAHAIVFQGLGGTKRAVDDLSNQLLLLYRLFFTTPIKENRDVIVEFPKSPVEVVLQQLKKYHNFGYKVCSYPEYTTSSKKEHSVLPLSNRFSILQESDVDTSDTEATDDALNSLSPTTEASFEDTSFDSEDITDDNWETYLRRIPGAFTRRLKRHEIRCRWEIHCAKATSCPYNHTAQEREIFQKYECQKNFSFKFWKAALCNNTMPHSRNQCPYAHASNDAWCLGCRSWGHFTRDCKAKIGP